MRYHVLHLTRYAYSMPVDLGSHVARLTPLERTGQDVVDASLTFSPRPSHLTRGRDHFGNEVHYAAIEQPHDLLEVTLDATVVVDRAVPADDGPAWEVVRDGLRDDGFPAYPEAVEFALDSSLAPAVAEAAAYARPSFPAGRPILAAARELTSRIRREFRYVPGVTTVTTAVEEILAGRKGVCQDFAHLQISALRGLGLAAGYVSGYLRTEAPAGQQKLRGADASHAWVTVWCGPGLGWVELDPTNDLVVGNDHIALAQGRDFADVSPLRGVILGGGAHTVEVEVTVTPLEDEEATSQVQ